MDHPAHSTAQSPTDKKADDTATDMTSNAASESAVSKDVSEKAAQAQPKQSAVEPSQPEAKKGWWDRMRESFQARMPEWVRQNSTRINQLGLMAGTTVIMGSIFRNRKISRDIWNAQEEILKKSGLKGAALEKKIGELVESKIMKKPGLHKQRMFYLGTAITGLGVSGFIKNKETPEQRESYKDMPMLPYIGMRIKHAFDPLNHSRQTAGAIGALSGVLAMVSGLSQPGGALISEIFVGGTLVAGFSSLALINDPTKATGWLNKCWASRLPFVISGTYETLEPKPVFPSPLPEIAKQKPGYAAGLAKAMQEGVKIPRWGLGIGKFAMAGRTTLTGEKAAAAFTKSFTAHQLPYKRRDWSYPIGQWFNIGMTTFNFLMSGSDKHKLDGAAAQAAVTPPAVETVSPASEIATAPVRGAHHTPASVAAVGGEMAAPATSTPITPTPTTSTPTAKPTHPEAAPKEVAATPTAPATTVGSVAKLERDRIESKPVTAQMTA